MKQSETRPRDFVWRLLAAAVLPFMVESAYIFFTRWPSSHFTVASDYAALTLSILIGSALFLRLPLWLPYRVFLLLFFYIPAIGVLLFFYPLLFLAVVFGEGL